MEMYIVLNLSRQQVIIEFASMDNKIRADQRTGRFLTKISEKRESKKI